MNHIKFIEMSPQKNTYLFKNKTLNQNNKMQIFRSFPTNYSNCHHTYGDFDDKENIN